MRADEGVPASANQVRASMKQVEIREPGAPHPSPLATPSPPGRRIATITGYSAALMWALLGLLTAASGAVPPFQLAAMAFALGAAVGFAWVAATGRWRDLV